MSPMSSVAPAGSWLMSRDPSGLCESRPRVFGRLEQPRNNRRLERAKQARPGVQLPDFGLMRTQARPEQTLPFGMLNFERVQRGEQRLGLSFAAGRPRPRANVAVGRRLAGVLQLGHLRRRPRQRFRDLPAAQTGLLAKLAEPLGLRGARLLDYWRA